MASEALSLRIEPDLEDGGFLPASSDLRKAKFKAEAYNRELDLPSCEDALYILISAERDPQQDMRQNVSEQPKPAKTKQKSKAWVWAYHKNRGP